MLIQIVLLATCVLFGGGLERFEQAQSQQKNDEKLAAILDAISKTSPEGKQIIEKVWDLKPEVNGKRSSQSLILIVSDYALNKGAYNINPLGWEASQKINGRWKIVLHYRTYANEILSAEWEYNEETNKLYPFEPKNAPYFWAGPQAGAKF